MNIPLCYDNTLIRNINDNVLPKNNYHCEIVYPVKQEIELFTYCLSYVISDVSKVVRSDFANEYFANQIFYDNRQSILMGVANRLFENTRFLSSDEEEALNVAFLKSLIKKPTLKGRK